MKKVTIKEIKQNNTVEIAFNYDEAILEKVRSLPVRKYIKENRRWIIPKTANYISDLKKHFGNTIELEILDSKGKDNIPAGYLNELNLRRYSSNTKRAYISSFRNFMEFFSQDTLSNLTDSDVNNYITHIVEEKKVSPAIQKQAINAIKFYFEKVLRRKVDNYQYKRPKREKTLPQVLSEKEIASILLTLKNLKHRTILTVIYSSGLRLSELLNLKTEDIDWDRKLISVKSGKGRKDRYTLLSPRLEKLLKDYLYYYKPSEYLFEGQKGGKYSPKSVQNIMQNAVKAAGITKHATVHTLRHSFATHLLENGTDLRYIQELFGHASSRTTEIYTHVSKKSIGKIRSPLDNLDM